MAQEYEFWERLPGEDNWEWCKRASAAIPAEVMVRELMKYIYAEQKRNDKRRRRGSPPLWSIMGSIFGNGSGVSCAIVARWLPEHKEP